jgi:mannose-1-phosphate guanylyltransferase
LKAFLLAAGNGTRLRPLTDHTPKCLLPIQGVPLLQIWLENCRAAGIREVLINTHSNAAQIREFVARQRSGVSVTIVEERELLGSAGTLAANRAFVNEQEEFFILYADVLTNMDLAEMRAFHRQKGVLATIGVYQVLDSHRCGIVTTDEKSIVQSFVEKPEKPQSNLAFSGVMIAQPQVLELVPSNCPADIGFHLLPQLSGSMAAYPIPSYLLDIGTAENYSTAQSSWPGLPMRGAQQPPVGAAN